MDNTWKNIQNKSKVFRMKPSEDAWNRVSRRLDNKERRVLRLHAGAWAVAASILGLVAITGLWLYRAHVQSKSEFTMHTPAGLELLNPADTDAVASMALDFTRYLEQKHPEMMQDF